MTTAATTAYQAAPVVPLSRRAEQREDARLRAEVELAREAARAERELDRFRREAERRQAAARKAAARMALVDIDEQGHADLVYEPGTYKLTRSLAGRRLTAPKSGPAGRAGLPPPEFYGPGAARDDSGRDAEAGEAELSWAGWPQDAVAARLAAKIRAAGDAGTPWKPDYEQLIWYRASDGQGGSVYCIDYQTQVPDYPTLVATRGPVRPVLPVAPADAAELERLLWLAGRKAVTSLAAAIETVFYNLRNAADGLDDRTCYDYAMRTLKAGRAGSWEAALLEEVVFFGDLNLDYKAPERNPTAASMRASAPSRRVHLEARDQMAAIISRWVTDPVRYTEVAETLADIVSYHAHQYGADGWRVIADQWLQSSAIGSSGYRSACYRLFHSRSEHYNPDWG